MMVSQPRYYCAVVYFSVFKNEIRTARMSGGCQTLAIEHSRYIPA
eukprot:SAG25_NODE_13725_length_263_cov_1.268293_1_plen_44_part_01